MDNISSLKDCYGCGVCVIGCPKKIIDLKLDHSGFYHPIIENPQQCVKCGICLKICAYNNRNELFVNATHESIYAYSGWSQNPVTRQTCSSGGVALELADYLLIHGYKACGVQYKIDKIRAEHFVAENIKDFFASIGSKYLQSYTLPGFAQLSDGEKYVVFGTPCQIASLRKFLKHKKIEDRFLLIDFFCHGVPSMLMWKKYLKYINKITGFVSDDIKWRNKKYGWHDSWVMTFHRKQKEFLSNLKDGDLFYNMFLSNRCLNKPCYTSCVFKMTNSSADIRIGDLWGKRYANNNLGVNGILALTERGNNILRSMDSIALNEETKETVLEGQMETSPKRDGLTKLDEYLLKTPFGIKSITQINLFVSKMLFLYYALRWKILKR